MAKVKEKIFVPTWYELLYFSLLGATLLVMEVVVSKVKDYDVRNYNFFSNHLRSIVDTKLRFLDTPRWETILTFGLWAICGILVYLALWFLLSLVTSYNNDSLPLHGFLIPKGYNRFGEVFTFIARGLVRCVAIVLTCVWLVMLLRSILPYLTHAFAAGLTPFTIRTVPTLLAASVMLGCSFYLLIVFIRLIFLRKRLFSRNVTE